MTRVARSRYERAVGYSCTVERKVLHEGKERTLKNLVHYPLDTRACIFWLRNRRRDAWSEKKARGPGRMTASAATLLQTRRLRRCHPQQGRYCRAVRDS